MTRGFFADIVSALSFDDIYVAHSISHTTSSASVANSELETPAQQQAPDPQPFPGTTCRLQAAQPATLERMNHGLSQAGLP